MSHYELILTESCGSKLLIKQYKYLDRAIDKMICLSLDCNKATLNQAIKNKFIRRENLNSDWKQLYLRLRNVTREMIGKNFWIKFEKHDRSILCFKLRFDQRSQSFVILVHKYTPQLLYNSSYIYKDQSSVLRRLNNLWFEYEADKDVVLDLR